MPFQSVVNLNYAPAQEGDFASANPRASVLAGPGALVAGPGGLTVGRFAWLDAATSTLATNAGTGLPNGFVHRSFGEAVITNYLGEVGNVIPPGFNVTLMATGDYWVKTKTAASIGQKAFANNADGTVSTGNSGATVAGALETKYTVMSAGAVGELVKISSIVQG